RQCRVRASAQSLQGEPRRTRGAIAAQGRALGRSEGQAQAQRPVALGGTTATAVYRASDRHRTHRPPHGRAMLGAPSHRHPPYRGADAAAQGELHDRHRHPQHAAGHARGRHDGVLLGRDVAERTNGISRGDGADEGNLRESTAEAHQGLHLGALQLTRLVSIAAATVLGLIVTAPTPGGGQARSAGALTLQGAGATFPAPLYHRWISVYTAEHPEVAIDYKDVGSGEGVKRFVGASVDFAASDGAMSD